MVSIDEAALYYRHSLQLAGKRCDIATNSKYLGSTLTDWQGNVWKESPISFSMQILANDDLDGPPRHPHFRGLHHVVIASFSAANVFVFDLLRRRVTATISGATARDRQFWNNLLLPIAMGVLGPTLGVVPIHCACLSDYEDGLLLAGASGAGKSTLSAALAQAGLDYISDDWTFLGKDGDKLVAHGMSAIVKLLPDAIKHFPNLANYPVRTSLNGELAYEVAIADTFGVSIRRYCQPRWFVFLERTPVPGSQFTPISAQQARGYIESSVERLPAQLAAAERLRANVISHISRLSCWTFRYGGTPQFAAGKIREFLDHQNQEYRHEG
jgi:hypothetical protein